VAAFSTRGQPIRSRRGRLDELTRAVELALADDSDHARLVAGIVRELAEPSPRRNAVTLLVTRHHDATAVRFHDASDRMYELDEPRHRLLARNAVRWSTMGGDHGRTISFEMTRRSAQDRSDERAATSILDRPARLAR
jgi:hypothetical protein